MALSPYKSPQSPLNRSRSSSCSSPIRNRFVFQEILSLGSSTLVRSYSCDQVFDRDPNGKPFQTTQIQVSSFITPPKKIQVNSFNGTTKTPRRLALESPEEDCQRRTREKKSKAKAKPSVLKTILKQTMMFTLLTVTSACALYLFMSYRECGYVWDLEKTEKELQENVYGQAQAVAKINSLLRTCNSTNDLHVMIFSGGAGVGKTYSSSIIARNFPWSSYKLITHTEFFAADVSNVLSQKLSSCGMNLLVVDDLSAESAKDAINLVEMLGNKRKRDENLLIILIFHSFTESDTSRIIGEFRNTYLNAYHVPFKALTEEAVESCFKSEINRQGVKISNVDLQKLVREKMKHVEIVRGPTGCKGVAEEVASFSKKPELGDTV